jgi:hypothetical protein
VEKSRYEVQSETQLGHPPTVEPNTKKKKIMSELTPLDEQTKTLLPTA